jgi:hypothetical protein
MREATVNDVVSGLKVVRPAVKDRQVLRIFISTSRTELKLRTKAQAEIHAELERRGRAGRRKDGGTLSGQLAHRVRRERFTTVIQSRPVHHALHEWARKLRKIRGEEVGKRVIIIIIAG